MSEFWKSNGLTLLHGDCREVMRALPEKSVQCCVTSPPYWGLRSYEGVEPSVWGDGDELCAQPSQGGHQWREDGSCDRLCPAWRGHLGLEPTPEMFTDHIVEVFREVWRVLRDDGTLWLNLGDSYTSNVSTTGGYSSKSTLQGYTGEHTKGRAMNRAENPQRLQHGLKPKDLCGIPWRVAFALQADGAASPAHMATIRRMIGAITDSYDSREQWPDKIAQEVERLEREWLDAHRGGWYLRSDIIWAKPNPMPESVTDRPTKAHEYIFLLTKKPRYFYDAEAVREKGEEHAGRAGTFARNGDVSEHVIPGQSAAEHRSDRTDRVPSGRNLRSVWQIPTQSFKGAHFATYPEKLVATCLNAGTSSKGCCPECGTPWRRVVEKERTFESGSGKSGNPINGKQPPVQGAGYGDVRKGPCIQSRTVGWEPGCGDGCFYGDGHIGIIPCTVLDPFIGSGTTLTVAKQLGLHGIGIDASKEYLEMARRRIENPRPAPEAPDIEGQEVMFQ